MKGALIAGSTDFIKRALNPLSALKRAFWAICAHSPANFVIDRPAAGALYTNSLSNLRVCLP